MDCMAATQNQIPITQVDIAIHEIAVSITTQQSYPDQLDDISNRAYNLLERVIMKAKEQNIDIRRFNYSDDESDIEEEEEEADGNAKRPPT
jgi:hypothetical protein